MRVNKGRGRWHRTVTKTKWQWCHKLWTPARWCLDLLEAPWFMGVHRVAEKIAPFYRHKGVRTSFASRAPDCERDCFRPNNVHSRAANLRQSHFFKFSSAISLHGVIDTKHTCRYYLSKMEKHLLRSGQLFFIYNFIYNLQDSTYWLYSNPTWW